MNLGDLRQFLSNHEDLEYGVELNIVFDGGTCFSPVIKIELNDNPKNLKTTIDFIGC